MKKICLFVIVMMGMNTLFAAEKLAFRVDLDGTREQVELSPNTQDGDTVLWHPNWGAEDTKSMRMTAEEKLTGTWTKVTMHFIPKKDGMIRVDFCGVNHKDPIKRPWCAITELRLNGNLINNNDVTDLKDDDRTPKGFSIANKAKIKVDADGRAIALVNHDNRLVTNIRVQKDKVYTLTLQAKLIENN